MSVEQYRKNYKLYKKIVLGIYLSPVILFIYVISSIFISYYSDIGSDTLFKIGALFFVIIVITQAIFRPIIGICPNCGKEFGMPRVIMMNRICPKCKINLEKDE